MVNYDIVEKIVDTTMEILKRNIEEPITRENVIDLVCEDFDLLDVGKGIKVMNKLGKICDGIYLYLRPEDKWSVYYVESNEAFVYDIESEEAINILAHFYAYYVCSNYGAKTDVLRDLLDRSLIILKKILKERID